jgi:hypothetical protein
MSCATSMTPCHVQRLEGGSAAPLAGPCLPPQDCFRAFWPQIWSQTRCGNFAWRGSHGILGILAVFLLTKYSYLEVIKICDCLGNPHNSIPAIALLQVAFLAFGCLPGAVGLRGRLQEVEGNRDTVKVIGSVLTMMERSRSAQ